ncbi:hypothetical protein EV424DRAFT_1535659 [Suillus variegatus]|nr:hypothetical protein EV424DRAFT_1544140 [Suillus variegatus]KAG1829637.1 hypothetical protein EV424DRAFT_1535659 [Suillus variegatus]
MAVGHAHELVFKGRNSQSHLKTTHLKHHTSAKNIFNMTALNISKLSFYVLLLSVAFAQILAVSAAENNLESDNVDGLTSDDASF